MSTPPKVRPQMILHAQQGVAWTVFDTKWVPSSARFAAVGGYARGTGTIQVFELNHGKLELRSEIERFSTFKCATFGASSIEDRHISVGDFDGRLSIWDLENSSLPVYTVKAHDKIINAIDGAGGLNMQGPPEIVTGGRDGCVKIWDPRQKEKPVLNLEPASSSSSSASAGGGVPDCWAVAFGNAYSDVERCVVAGFSNGDVKLFDLRTSTMRWETNVKNGVCSLEFDRKDIEMNKLLVTGLEGRFRVYDMRTYHPEKGYAYVQEKAHESTIWCGRHLPQNREVFITAGGAGGLHLYKYSYPCQRAKKDAEGIAEGVPGSVTLLNKTTVSTQPVCSIDWHRDKEGLACMAAFDQAVRVLIVTPNY